MIGLERRESSDTKDRSPSNKRPRKTKCGEPFVKTESEKDGELNESLNGSLIANGSPSRYRPITMFVLFWISGIISFGEYFFVENENVNCQFVNVFGNDKCDNCFNGLLYWMPKHTNKFNNSCVLLSENNTLEYIFGVVFYCDWNENCFNGIIFCYLKIIVISVTTQIFYHPVKLITNNNNTSKK